MLSNANRFTAGRSETLLRRALLPTLLLSALAPSAYAAGPAAAGPEPDPDPASGSVDFDPRFFPTGNSPKVDLSRFARDNVVLPGTYRGDIFVNKVWQARTDLVFAAVPGLDNAQACFDSAALVSIGVDVKKVLAQTEDPSIKKIPEGQFCGPIGDYIPGATAEFDSGTQELSLFVPQIYTNQTARGYVDPSQWDEGINAGVLAYNTNLYRSDSHGQSLTSAYVGINASMNVGSWHAVHQGSLTWSNRYGRNYQSSASYLQHDIPSMRAQLVVGDTFTPGDLFDSVRLRGARLFTDDRMLPQSLRGYAPIVRGIADTNANVIIRQRGYIIYDANVAPGPFEIDDLYPTGYGGDLDVEVVEADGRVQRFSIPFSSVPQSLRPGLSRWSVAGGKVEQLNLANAPYVLQGTYQRGLTNALTAYAGATLATDYHSVLAGAALNTQLGAFSADVTQARNTVPGQSATQGVSIRLGYNKNILETGTNFAVAAYRYSTSGFVGLNDSVALRDAAARGYSTRLLARQRNRLDLSVNQALGEGNGQLYLQGSVMNYWGGQGKQVNFSAGYSNRWKAFNYSFTAQRTLENVSRFNRPGNVPVNQIPGAPDPLNGLSIGGRRDTRLMFTVSMPLGAVSAGPQLTSIVSHAKDGGTNSQATVSGSAGADQRLNYSATVGQAEGSGAMGSLSGQYRGPLAQVAAGYSQGSGYRQVSASASGSMVAHGGGVTFSPPTGETIGLIHAPDATGATISNGQGSTVDGRGYGVVPNLMPYQLNTVSLDPKGIDAGVELKSTSANVAPRAGSVVMLKYDTAKGRALMIETTLPDGRPVPFGANVFDAQGTSVGIAGQGSRLYIRDMPASGTLTVKWGEAAADACRINVELPPAAKKGHRADLEMVQAACQADGTVTAQKSTAQDHPVSQPIITKPVAALDAIQRYPGVYGTPSMPANRFATTPSPNPFPGLSTRAAG